MAPGSYFNAVQTKGDYFYCPWHDIIQDNFYRGLDFAYEHGEALMEHAVKHHHQNSGKEIRVAFFDCTNTWFETPYDDATWQIIRFTRDKVRDLRETGLDAKSIEEYLDGGDFARKLSEELDLQKDTILRMRGNSKEGRYAQPIVTVALAIDQSGFPVDCKVFAGNLSEIHTVEPMIESLKRKYAVKDIYFVAYNGLNSAEKLERIQREKLGFVVAQKVSRQNRTVQDQMFDLEGYRNCEVREDGSFAASAGQHLNEAGYRFKVCDHVKKFRREVTEKDGTRKTRVETVRCKIIYTFSPERRSRDLADLDQQVAKARNAVNAGILLGNQYGSGWRSLLRTKKEECSDKEEKEMFRACSLKTDVIEERRKAAGYAAVVFSHPEGGDASKLSDIEVLSTYHRLVSIEDCFRVMKSTFSIRPVYVRLHDHVVAHCYLCVLSLIMMRIVQEKLEGRGHRLSCGQISEALSQALLVPMTLVGGNLQGFMNVGISGRFYQPAFTGMGMHQGSVNQLESDGAVWEKYKARREAEPFAIDRILEAVGLQKLNLYNSVKDAKQKLGILSVPASSLLAPEQISYMAMLGGNAIR